LSADVLAAGDLFVAKARLLWWVRWFCLYLTMVVLWIPSGRSRMSKS